MLLGDPRESLCSRDGALPKYARLRARQIDHGRRSTGQLAAVQHGSDSFDELDRNLVESPRIRAAVQVGARRREDTDPLQKLGGDPAQLGYTDANRVGTGTAQPRKPSCGIGHNERKGPHCRRDRGSSGISSRSASTLAATSAIG